MESPKKQAANILHRNKLQRRWMALVLCLSLVVSTVTATALKLNGQALTNPPRVYACAFAPHAHTAACGDPAACGMATFAVHTHDERCYDDANNLICTMPEIVEHTHGGDCYATVETLTCGQQECEPTEGHTHTDACYTTTAGEPVLTCGMEEHTHTDACYTVTTDDEGNETGRELTCALAEHAHTDACYTPGEDVRTLTCGLEETPATAGHTHTADCYTTEQALTCTLPEVALHTHTDECYDIQLDEAGNEVSRTLTCDKLEVLAHQHTDACFKTEAQLAADSDAALDDAEATETEETTPEYICGLEEHTHTDECAALDEDGNAVLDENGDPTYTCGLEEHTHTAECASEDAAEPEETDEPEYTCGLTEHTHTDECLALDEDGNALTDEEGNPVYNCGLVEHTHTEECLPTVEPVTLTHDEDGEDYAVTVTFDPAAFEGPVTLHVREIDPDSEEYQQYYQQSLDAMGAEELTFARYFDITFQNEAGEEVEPNEGYSVDVKIAYDQAQSAPTGNDTQIVHFGEDSTNVLEAQTDEENAVNFSSDSFSVFGTVNGSSLENQGKYVIYVEDNGEYYALKKDSSAVRITVNNGKIEFDSAQNQDDFLWTYGTHPNRFSMDPFYYVRNDNGADAVVDPVVIGNIKEDYEVKISSGSDGGKIYQCTSPEGVIGYLTLSDDKSKMIFQADEGKAATVYFATESQAGGTYEGYTPMSTADTRSKGITINLYDYDGQGENGKAGSGERGTINKVDDESYRSLLFWADGMGKENGNKKDLNHGVTGATAKQGIVSSTLGDDGYPTLSGQYGGTTNESLKYLFDENTTGVKGAYKDLNHLFSYDQATGYYSYDSDHNLAWLPDKASGTDFEVFNEPRKATLQGGGSAGNPGFLPFDKPVAQGSDNSGNTQDLNYFFGMEVEFQFVQPKDGQVNSSNMVFDFSGDDDMWVFIDGVLILDVGGIHGKCNGHIDFATGKVTVDNTEPTTIRKILETVGKGSQLTPGKDTYDDYTAHDVKIIYFERGGVVSNCFMRFNIPTLPKDTVSIGKQVDSNCAEYTDATFDFFVKTGDATNSLQPYHGYYQVCKNGLDGGVELKDGNYLLTTDGHLELKHGEVAVLVGSPIVENKITTRGDFEGIPEHWYYTVTESDSAVNDISSMYNVASIDKEITIKNETENGKTVAVMEPIKVGKKAMVTFKNELNTANEVVLGIGKQLDGATDKDKQKEFPVKVTLGGKPYLGKYYSNETCTTEASVTKDQNDQSIIMLKPSETVYIKGVLWGTSVKVEEITTDLNKETYKDPTYKRTKGNSTTTEGANTFTVDKLIGDALNTGLTIVTVVNSYKQAQTQDLTIHKVGKTSVDATTMNNLEGAEFTLYGEYNKESETPLGKEINKKTTDENGNAEFTDLSIHDTYYLKETKQPSGYVENKTVYEIKWDQENQKFTVKDADNSTDLATGRLEGNTLTITNTFDGLTVKFVKMASGAVNKDGVLSGAEFELQKLTDDGKVDDSFTAKSATSDANGKFDFESLPIGTYILTEKKAPNGYLALTNTVTLTVKEGSGKLETEAKITNGAALVIFEGAYRIDNNTGAELPKTGGENVALYWAGGYVLLVMAAGVWLARRNKGAAR